MADTKLATLGTRQSRLFWIDIIRAIAILSIVYTHTSEEIFIYFAPEHLGFVNTGFVAISRIIGRVGVPMFLMLSGYMGIRKSFDSVADIRTFYARKILPLLKNYFFWVLLMGVYFFLYARLSTGLFPPILDYGLAVAKQAVFLGQQFGDGYYYRQIWFVGVIIIMWLITPALSAIKNSFGSFKAPLIILLAVSFLASTANDLIGVLHIDALQKFTIHSPLNWFFFNICLWAGYYLIGYLCVEKLPFRSNIASLPSCSALHGFLATMSMHTIHQRRTTTISSMET